MIITSGSTGPRYSTDATASSVTHFVSSRHTMHASAQRENVVGVAAALESLYPELFAAPQPSRREKASGAIHAAYEAVVAVLERAFGRRHAERTSRTAAAIASRYAPKR